MTVSRIVSMGSALLLSLGAVACNGNSQSTAPTEPAPASTPAPTPTSAPTVTEEPNQDNLEMTCTGSITVNDIDFTAYFTREAGFSRIELKRSNSGEVFAKSFLSYDRQNDQGQAVWRGSVNEMATVTLVHLSSNPAQLGDEISVGYDGQWGRGTCR